MWDMTETVHLRASYRYASHDARDAAIVAALGAMEHGDLRYQLSLGAIVTVDVDVSLFGDHDYAVFDVLARGAIERSVHPEITRVEHV
jgi:hypothetical protein